MGFHLMDMFGPHECMNPSEKRGFHKPHGAPTRSITGYYTSNIILAESHISMFNFDSNKRTYLSGFYTH